MKKKLIDCFSDDEKLMTIRDAKKIMKKFVEFRTKIELINVENSQDRILAQDIKSKIDVPKNDNSAVDGFGFNHKELRNETINLKVIGVSKPGDPFLGKLQEGEAIKIFTGAPILNQKNSNFKIDTVVMEENCFIRNNNIQIKKKIRKGDNIRLKGEDICEGKKIFLKGKKIRSFDLGFLLSVGLKKIKVFKKIKVGIFSSGNELHEEKSKKNKYSIYDSNKITLISLFNKIGCVALDFGILKDNYSDTKKKLKLSIKKCDVLVTSGGISSSEVDKIKLVLKEIGDIKFSKILAKPGRPFSFAMIKNKPFFGLPGNPVAVIVTFSMLVTDYIKKISGRKYNAINYQMIPSSFSFKKKIIRTEWLRGSITCNSRGLFLTKYKTEGSGILSSIADSDGIIELDDTVQIVKKGQILKFYKFEDILN